MAPIPPDEHLDRDAVYLPSLENCFSNKQRLLSWKLCFHALNRVQNAHKSQSLEQFFADEITAQILRRPLDPFAKPSPQSKADFETRTAAIHVTPSKDGGYDIEEIKADSVWLSSETSIDEVSALRLVVLEWQDRTYTRILESNATESGVKESQVLRRRRLLDLLLEEKSNVLAVYLCTRSAKTSKRLTQPENGHQSKDSDKSHSTASAWLHKISASLGSSGGNTDKSGLSQIFDGIENRLSSLQQGCKWSTSPDFVDGLDLRFRSAQLLDVYRLLQLLFVDMTSVAIQSTENVKQWFELAERYFFFAALDELPPEYSKLSSRVQSLACLISLQVLSLKETLEVFESVSDDVSSHYALDFECRKCIDSAIYSAVDINNALGSLAAFAWSVILLNLLNHPAVSDLMGSDSVRSPGPTVSNGGPAGKIVDAVSRFQLGRDDALEAAAKLAESALDLLRTFAVAESISQDLWSTIEPLPGDIDLRARSLLFDLIRQGVEVSNYGPELMSAVLSVLNANTSSTNLSTEKSNAVDRHLASLFASDESVFIPGIIEQTLTRYPYEMQPFLRLWTALCLHLGHEDDRYYAGKLTTRTLTLMLPLTYQNYEIEGSHHISLTRPLPLILGNNDSYSNVGSQSRSLVLANQSNASFEVPVKTRGAILTDGKPLVVQFHHHHLVIEYLAAILATAPASSRQHLANSDSPSADVLADIINFITANILSVTRSANTLEDLEGNVEQFLGLASETLDRNTDIISVVQDIFEQTIDHQVQDPDPDTLHLLTSCVDFLNALFPALPGRVWPAIIRSGLTNVDSGKPSIAGIVSAAELPAGRYDFFEAAVNLYKAAVDDLVKHSLHRRIPTVASNYRFNGSKAGPASTLKGTDKSLVDFTRTCVEFLQTSTEWYFTQETQRRRIISCILSTFKQILLAQLGHENTPIKPDQGVSPSKLCSELEPSASYILTTLSAQPNQNPFLVSMKTFITKGASSAESVSTKDGLQSAELSISVLNMLSLLARICKVRNMASTGFINHLRDLFPDLVAMYVAQVESRTDIVQLLLDIVETSESTTDNYQSLFGTLGEAQANSFITILTDFGSPLDDIELEEKIWRFLTNVIASKYRWFATLLLTGLSPKEALKSKDSLHHRSLVSDALEFLEGKVELSSKRCQSRLRFLTAALNHWQWTTWLIQKRPTLRNKLADFTTASYTQDNSSKSTEAMIEAANQFTTLSLVADFLAAYVYNLRQMKSEGKDFVKHLMERISAGSLEHDGVAAPNYNVALHQNLENLFKKKFSGWSPTAFKGTLGLSTYGPKYFYDFDYAREVLSFSPAWKIALAEEFSRVNCNLSVVQSQVVLAKAWKSLALELSAWCYDGTANHRQLAYIAHKCLYANKHRKDEPFYNELTFSRTDLALVILQRLVDAGSTVAPIATLRALILDAISAYAQGEDIPLMGLDAAQYRTLLRMLLLALQVRPSSSGAKDLSAPSDLKDEAVALLDIISFVVTKGFRTLATQVYDNAGEISPIDFALITSTLRGILVLPAAQPIATQIGIQLVQSNVAQYAVALFSWSDRITLDENDPIFAEISITFLLQLSHLQVVTDNFATEGLLSQISTSNIMNVFRRRRGANPFDKPLRLFSIWSHGILPLCLNMLTMVGETLAAEVIAFLNSFAPQLERASNSLDPKELSATGTLSLSTLHEAHTLAMLSRVLERYRESPAGSTALAEIGELKWDKAGVKEDVETWLQGSKAAIRERITPTSAREEQLLKDAPLSERDGFESRLEEMVWRELEGTLGCLDGTN